MDWSEAEKESLNDCKKSLAEIIGEIGWHVAPKDWTQKNVEDVIEGVVKTWNERVPF